MDTHSQEDLIKQDVLAYLDRHEQKDMLRLLTCGSVDDGKSTLIGRLLYDTKMIYEDQLAAVQRDSAAHGTTGGDFDPALLTDGLKAEREQGITIDVAYRYFSTDRRNFIIADCPGHEQYTRNMVTGASNCDLAIILIDARHGVLEQTCRHSFICSLLGIKHLVVAVNKMDAVGYSREVFEKVRRDYEGFAAKLEASDIHFIPMSALVGDNVAEPSTNMPWFQGAPILRYLEEVTVAGDRNLIDLRLPVQYVQRPDLNFRGFSGTVASGVIRKGDTIVALPSRKTSKVSAIYTTKGEADIAYPPLSATVTLEDEIDISRGDMLVHPKNMPTVGQEVEAVLVWMNDEPLAAGRTYDIKAGTKMVQGEIETVEYRFDVNTLHRKDTETLNGNEIGRVRVSLHEPIAYDAYSRNQHTGAFIIIDRVTNATIGGGMILDRVARSSTASRNADAEPKSRNITAESSLVSPDERAALLRQKPATLWFTGLSGSGKSTIAKEVERRLVNAGHAAFVLDGDNVRHGLNRDLGFSADDRTENIRRISEVARLLNDAGLLAITSFISPYKEDRANAGKAIGEDRFIEILVDAPLAVCEQRDPKGLYKKARDGEIALFTGVSAPYEAPGSPDVVLTTEDMTPEEAADKVIEHLRNGGYLEA